MSFSRHACAQLSKTSEALGLKTSIAEIKKVFEKAAPEVPKSPSTRFHLFKRTIKHGKTKYFIADGWRFAVADNKVVTVERIKPHENHKYLRNFIPRRYAQGRR